MKVDGKTEIYAIIGNPIEHSLSPIIHNVAFKELNLNAVYVAFKVTQENLVGAVNGLKSLGVKGFNVTIPHKVSIIPLLDEVEPLTLQIGAVNTVKNKDGKLVGYNTDGLGALEALREKGVNPDNKKIVIVGAGGAARAIGFTLAKYAKKLVILNRTEEKAVELSKVISENSNLPVEGLKLTHLTLEEKLKDADIVINATSVGMHPKVEETPIPKNFITSKMTVFDVVYNPLKTRLLREAEEMGAKTVDGLGMLIHQAVKAFEIWTGLKPSPKTMLQAALKELRKQP